MRTYRAGQPPQEPKDVPDFLRAELASIEQAANRADPQSELIYLHAEPARVRAGMLVLADGTNWNPGSGEGVYRRNAANTAWVAVAHGNNAAFVENDQTITADYTLTTGKNAVSGGPITINTGVTVTVPTGATWSIV